MNRFFIQKVNGHFNVVISGQGGDVDISHKARVDFKKKKSPSCICTETNAYDKGEIQGRYDPLAARGKIRIIPDLQY